ncbi:MAG: xanthine dehydrogenase family protein molybdopterin-binding subunit [Chloroflexi bacterium]|nr:xanthine dehydrogenase family protein molybdopterin-binding subunit [Chloroflexota bacterium]
MVTAANERGTEAGLRWVGRRTRRTDAPERLNGRVRFTADLPLPGALHLRLVRSPYAAATICAIDGNAALAVPGVLHVLTARDLAVATAPMSEESGDLHLALERVYYAGQPVAVVVAETDSAAEDGAALVEVEYEQGQAVVDLDHAMQLDTPAIREGGGGGDDEELAMHGAAGGSADAGTEVEGANVLGRATIHRGDVEAAFRDADAVVEQTFTTSWVHQGYIEPLAAAAAIDPLGTLVVYTSTQAMFWVQSTVCRLLGLPTHAVRVVAMPVGGGFGGKFGLLEGLAAAVAWTLKRPVVLVYSRQDEFTASTPAPATRIRVKVGGTRDGTLTALDAEVLFDCGSSPGSPARMSGMMIASLYRWAAYRVSSAEVLTNRLPNGAYRAPGQPQVMFALESAIDELARTLGIDPLDVRLRSAVVEGDPHANGARWPNIGLSRCLALAAEHYRAEKVAAAVNEGVGIAIGGWMGGVEPASATCRLNQDGSLTLNLGAVDISGAGTTFQLIAAEAFGLDDYRRVRVVQADTDSAPYAGASGGSKITYTVGTSVQRAAVEAREQALRIAADVLEAAPEDLELVGDDIRVQGVPSRATTLRQVAEKSMSFGARYEPVFGRGQSAIIERSPGFAVHVVRVHVDPETGRVTPVRYVAVQDVGRAINPAAVEGQMMGGAVQAVGWGLLERMEHDEVGTPLTASFLDYALPRATQSPELETVVVEVPSKAGPYGARPVGEPPVIPGAAAIANAVRDAVGVRVADLPLTSERVHAALVAGRSA